MKNRTLSYYPLFFAFFILASIFLSAFQNVSSVTSSSDNKLYQHFSFVDGKQQAACDNFLCEEVESENETSFSHKMLCALLPQFFVFFETERSLPVAYASHTFRGKQLTPIYISVCSFRI